MIDTTRLRKSEAEQAGEVAEETSRDPAVLAAGASVVLSWYLYFLRGNRHAGLFVGLWPPTILAFASYFSQTRMADSLNVMMRGEAGGVMGTIDSVVRNR